MNLCGHPDLQLPNLHNCKKYISVVQKLPSLWVCAPPHYNPCCLRNLLCVANKEYPTSPLQSTNRELCWWPEHSVPPNCPHTIPSVSFNEQTFTKRRVEKPSLVLSIRTNDYLCTHKHAQAEVPLMPQSLLVPLKSLCSQGSAFYSIWLSVNFNTFNENTKTITHMHVGLNFNWSHEPNKFKGSNTFWTHLFREIWGWGWGKDICTRVSSGMYACALGSLQLNCLPCSPTCIFKEILHFSDSRAPLL